MGNASDCDRARLCDYDVAYLQVLIEEQVYRVTFSGSLRTQAVTEFQPYFGAFFKHQLAAGRCRRTLRCGLVLPSHPNTLRQNEDTEKKKGETRTSRFTSDFHGNLPALFIEVFRFSDWVRSAYEQYRMDIAIA